MPRKKTTDTAPEELPEPIPSGRPAPPAQARARRPERLARRAGARPGAAHRRARVGQEGVGHRAARDRWPDHAGRLFRDLLGSSERQLGAIADGIAEGLRDEGIKPIGREGSAERALAADRLRLGHRPRHGPARARLSTSSRSSGPTRRCCCACSSSRAGQTGPGTLGPPIRRWGSVPTSHVECTGPYLAVGAWLASEVPARSAHAA